MRLGKMPIESGRRRISRFRRSNCVLTAGPFGCSLTERSIAFTASYVLFGVIDMRFTAIVFFGLSTTLDK